MTNNPPLSRPTYHVIVRMLTTMCSSCPDLAVVLLKDGKLPFNYLAITSPSEYNADQNTQFITFAIFFAPNLRHQL